MRKDVWACGPVWRSSWAAQPSVPLHLLWPAVSLVLPHQHRGHSFLQPSLLIPSLYSELILRSWFLSFPVLSRICLPGIVLVYRIAFACWSIHSWPLKWWPKGQNQLYTCHQFYGEVTGVSSTEPNKYPCNLRGKTHLFLYKDFKTSNLN